MNYSSRGLLILVGAGAGTGTGAKNVLAVSLCSELRMILQFCGLNCVPLGT